MLWGRKIALQPLKITAKSNFRQFKPLLVQKSLRKCKIHFKKRSGQRKSWNLPLKVLGKVEIHFETLWKQCKAKVWLQIYLKMAKFSLKSTEDNWKPKFTLKSAGKMKNWLQGALKTVETQSLPLKSVEKRQNWLQKCAGDSAEAKTSLRKCWKEKEMAKFPSKSAGNRKKNEIWHKKRWENAKFASKR